MSSTDVEESVQEESSDEDEATHDTFVLNNVWRVKSAGHNPRWRSKRSGPIYSSPTHKPTTHDFEASVLINNRITKILADTALALEFQCVG